MTSTRELLEGSHPSPSALTGRFVMACLADVIPGPAGLVVGGTTSITDLGTEMEPGSLFARWLFLDPAAPERIVNWADFAAPAVGALRYEVGRHPDDRPWPAW